MQTVKVAEVRMGDSIRVDLGKGKIFRPVDHISQNGDNVTVVLFSSFGTRPKFTINKNALIVRE